MSLKVKLLDFGPSRVRALPLSIAAERSVLYFWDYFSFFFSFLFYATYFSPRRGCPRVRSFKSPKNKIWGNKNQDSPLAPWGALFSIFLPVHVRSPRASARGAFMITAQLQLNELN